MSVLEEIFQHNCSTIFLLYPLEIERGKLASLGFIGSFLRDAERKDIEYSNPVFLLFKPQNPTLFQAWLDAEYERVNKATGTIDIIEDYDYPDGYVVVVYQFPKEYEADYENFMKGRYSKMTAKFADTFPTAMITTNKQGIEAKTPHTALRIISKEENFKKFLEEELDIVFDKSDELWSIPSMDKETLSYKKIKEWK